MEEEPVSENLYACPSCKVRIVEGELELCSVCKSGSDAVTRFVTCSKCGSGFGSAYGRSDLCATCTAEAHYASGGVVSGTHSHGVTWTLPETAGIPYSYYVDADGTVHTMGSGAAWTGAIVREGSFVRLDGGELDLGLSRTMSGASTTTTIIDEVYEMVEEPTVLDGVGLTSLMLMDAAERKLASLPVRVVVAVEREIDRMLSNPVLEGCGMTRSDFLTLASASSGWGLRGHERASVFVDHYVWEVGAPSYLDMLRLELQYLR